MLRRQLENIVLYCFNKEKNKSQFNVCFEILQLTGVAAMLSVISFIPKSFLYFPFQMCCFVAVRVEIIIIIHLLHICESLLKEFLMESIS